VGVADLLEGRAQLGCLDGPLEAQLDLGAAGEVDAEVRARVEERDEARDAEHGGDAHAGPEVLGEVDVGAGLDDFRGFTRPGGAARGGHGPASPGRRASRRYR